MKRMIKAANTQDRKSIDQLTEEEIEALPDRITLVTREPGASKYVPEF